MDLGCLGIVCLFTQSQTDCMIWNRVSVGPYKPSVAVCLGCKIWDRSKTFPVMKKKLKHLNCLIILTCNITTLAIAVIVVVIVGTAGLARGSRKHFHTQDWWNSTTFITRHCFIRLYLDTAERTFAVRKDQILTMTRLKKDIDFTTKLIETYLIRIINSFKRKKY